MIELNDTIEQMQSSDYKERFKAEYNQLNIRLSKLKIFVDKYENGELNFKPSCSLLLLKKQIYLMQSYLDILVERANIEKIWSD